MTKLTVGAWSLEDSDLVLHVYRVYSKSLTHWKISGILVNKHNGTMYQKINKILINHKMERIYV